MNQNTRIIHKDIHGTRTSYNRRLVKAWIELKHKDKMEMVTSNTYIEVGVYLSENI